MHPKRFKVYEYGLDRDDGIELMHQGAWLASTLSLVPLGFFDDLDYYAYARDGRKQFTRHDGQFAQSDHLLMVTHRHEGNDRRRVGAIRDAHLNLHYFRQYLHFPSVSPLFYPVVLSTEPSP